MTTVHEYLQGRDAYKLDPYRYPDNLDYPRHWSDLASVHSKNMPASETWYVPMGCQASDYSGSLIARANANVFLQLAQEHGIPSTMVCEIVGNHGSFGVAIRGDLECEELLDLLSSMQQYTCADDNEHQRLMDEAVAMAWENWARTSFIAELERLHNCTFSEESEVQTRIYQNTDTEYEYDPVHEVFSAVLETCNESWINESGMTAYIDTYKVAQQVTWDDIRDLAERE